MNSEDYNSLLEKQKSKCAACGSDEAGGQGSFHVDHDHKCCPSEKSCGKCVRALLCMRCNSALGIVKDSPELLQSLLHYLNSFKPVESNYVISTGKIVSISDKVDLTGKVFW